MSPAVRMRSRTRVRLRRPIRELVVLSLSAFLVAGCSWTTPAPARSTAPTALPAPPATAKTMTTATIATTSPGDAALGAVQRAIADFNATAGGPVSVQQAALHSLVSSGQQAAQQACPIATSTISLEPVYSRLEPAPSWRPSSGTLPGVVYAIPTLIRIHSGDRITGTDLTDLHLAIDENQVRFPSLCLN